MSRRVSEFRKPESLSVQICKVLQQNWTGKLEAEISITHQTIRQDFAEIKAPYKSSSTYKNNEP